MKGGGGGEKYMHRLNRGNFTIFFTSLRMCAQMWVAPTRDMHLVNHDPAGFF